MTKIGLPVTRMDLDAPLAKHFGKAKWLAILEPPGRCQFIRNPWLEGGAVAAELASHGCTDVVARHMGCGAYARVTASGMRAWEGDDAVTARVVADRLATGTLRPLSPDDCGHRGPQGHGGERHLH